MRDFYIYTVFSEKEKKKGIRGFAVKPSASRAKAREERSPHSGDSRDREEQPSTR
jgi:hypothetical protein